MENLIATPHNEIWPADALRAKRRAALAISFLTLGGMVGLVSSQGAHYRAGVGHAVTVPIDISARESSRLKEVVVELPDGVIVQPEVLSAPDSPRGLTLPWDGRPDGGSIPLVLKGLIPGKQIIHFKFLDGSRRLMEEKRFEVRFELSPSPLPSLAHP